MAREKERVVDEYNMRIHCGIFHGGYVEWKTGGGEVGTFLRVQNGELRMAQKGSCGSL